MLFDLQIFSGGVFPSSFNRAQPHIQSIFLFPIVFVITVRIGYRVTGYNDLPGIMIGLTKIKIKTSKRHSKYHYVQCISAVVIYRI